MTQITLPSGNYLLVEVESIFFNFRIGKASVNKGHLFASCAVTSGKKWELPNPGQWSIIGKCSELSEDDWKGIVETVQMPNEPMYYKGYGDADYVATTNASKSGLSLIASHNLKPETTLILKNNQPC